MSFKVLRTKETGTTKIAEPQPPTSTLNLKQMKPTYYIGDLCYVMHDEWDEVCELLFPHGSGERTGRLHLKDEREFFIFGTEHGDGEYKDQFGDTYGVDSGTIGAIRVQDIRDTTYSEEAIKDLGCIHTFETPLTPSDCSYDNGKITFRNVVIDTDPQYFDEEDEEDDEKD